jgi:hypothetical protein
MPDLLSLVQLHMPPFQGLTGYISPKELNEDCTLNRHRRRGVEITLND